MGGTHTGWRLAALALAWLAGVALQLNERELLPPAWYAAGLACGGLCLAAVWRWRRLALLGCLGAALLGFGASGWRASDRMAEQLPLSLEGRDVQVTGTVASLPLHGTSGLRFRFAIEDARDDGQPVALPQLVALGWYKGFKPGAALSAAQQGLRAGQRWRFTVRLRRPHGNLNPHGFDYELHLFEQGVRATGYVRDAPALLIDRHASYPIERWRQQVRDAIATAVVDPRAAGVLAALAVGDQSAIVRDDWELFRNTGIAHLVSISGLHVTMFAWVAGLCVAALWRRSARAVLWLPTPQAARWGGLALALAYALFSGWGVPAQRTVWMLASVTALQAVGTRWPWPLVLLAAAVVVTGLDPWALLQPGFWLSFVAVGLLMASDTAQGARAEGAGEGVPAHRLPWARAVWGHMQGGVRTQLVATLGLTPLSLVFFQQVSVVGLLANLMAIPLVTLVITPLALLGVVAAPLWWLGAELVRLMCAVLAWLAAWPGAVWVGAAAPPWAQAAGLAAAVLLIMPLPWRLRVMAVPLALPLLLPPLAVPGEGRFELLAADVGQGTAVLVRTRQHLLVYDAGPQYSRESDAGQRVLLPLLRARGESRVDRLMLSHRDSDHVGGARSLLQALEVGDVSSSLEDGHPLRELGVHARCMEGQSWQWDGVRFEVLHPPDAAQAPKLKPNALSCVLRVSSAASGSALLTGDIERAQEARLVATYGQALRSDVLVAPHHGSKTSSTAAFLDAVQPRVAVFQAGYRNRFGHPAPEVLERYRARRIAVADSANCGAWRWPAISEGEGEGEGQGEVQGVCERDLARRYWHHPRERPAPVAWNLLP